VTIESQKAGRFARTFIHQNRSEQKILKEILIDEHIQHIIPQVINFNNVVDPIELSFRTLKKYEKVNVTITQSNQLIKTKILTYVTPAEMQKVSIKASDLILKDPLYVNLEEV
jgi:hypothetical protein